MSDAPRILVTGVGSNIGQGILKALRHAYPAAHVVGTDMRVGSIGAYACNAFQILPRAPDADYPQQLTQLIERERVQLVMIGSNAEVLVLARERARIEAETGARVIVGSPEAVERCIDKWATAELLRQHGCNHPRSTLDVAEAPALGFPLVVKPRRGQGSNGVFVVHDRDELARAASAARDPMFQELVGSAATEFTAAVFCTRAGEVASVLVMRRELVAGTTVLAEIVAPAQVADIEAEVRRVATTAALPGPMNVQLRVAERGAVTFEINPRFSGTTGMRALAGWNDVKAAVDHFLYDRPVQLLMPPPGRVERFYDEVFIPKDGSAPRAQALFTDR